ncbi:hypothetical protein DFH09DRAFT_1370394 [Mycena vulgaris]|nr:hypothetical protein DFH09DRAFT_1370394 [Mycena vulgaris]
MSSASIPTDSEVPNLNSAHLAAFPSEILGEIFLASIPPLGRSPDPPAHFPWTMSHVCRHWRASALSFPTLWSFLDVEQTQENEENTSPTLDLIKTYLQRSGQHPLTFRLAYAQETIHGHPFLECLFQHSARWETVHFESLALLAVETLSGEVDVGEFPKLRSLECSYCEFDSDAVGEDEILHPIPWPQLKRYHEYSCSWYPDCGRQWAIVQQLTNVVDFRAAFYGVSDSESVIEMPHLRFASLAVDRRADQLTINEVLECFDLPRLEGLNLDLWMFHPEEVLCPMPGMLKTLKILRLCGAVEISNESLTCILTELTMLTELSVALPEFDAQHMFTLLTPGAETVLVPKLQAVRVVDFACDGETLEVVLAMLQARFGGVDGAEFTLLRSFTLWMPWNQQPPSIFDSLKAVKERKGWDIRLHANWQGRLWEEEMDETFL